jgi:hypothetical protein
MSFRFLSSLLVLTFGLSACGVVPHPFEDAKLPPHASILALTDSVGIVVEPVRGAPAPTAQALAEAMATALQAAEVLASTTPGNQSSLHLVSEASGSTGGPGLTAIRIRWSMRSAEGAEIGTDLQQEMIADDQWTTGSGQGLTQLMQREAPRIAALVQDAPVVEHKPTRQVFVRTVEGAPGDGGKSLPRALVYLLKRASVDVTTDSQAVDTITIVGNVAVKPLTADQEHVQIEWRVLKPDGSEVGKVAQENTIPRGSLDGSWGEVSMAVANSAVNDIIRVVNLVPENK